MSKFLVLNPNPEDLELVLAKANLQNSKNGPFEAVLLLGNPSNSNDWKAPTIDITQPTYVASDSTELSDIKENFHRLNSTSCLKILTLKCGFTIGYLTSHVIDVALHNEILTNKHLPLVDILVTYHWPEAISLLQKLSLVGNSFIDSVVKVARPRYHFAVGSERGRFFETDSFSWKDEPNHLSTRFISLGQNGSGDKWFYAFALNEIDSMENVKGVNFFEQQPMKQLENDSTPSQSLKRPATEELDRPVAKKVQPSQCFFCLSNPKCETHMIISVGQNCYMTIAKGPLTRPGGGRGGNTAPLDFSGHAIIIPIEHIPSIRSISTSVMDTPLYQEIIKYQDSLIATFSQKAPDYRLVFFEINKLSNVHQHTQFLPVPLHAIGSFEDVLEEKTKMNNEKFVRNQSLTFQKFTNPADERLVSILNGSDHIIFTVSGERKTYYVAKLVDDKPVDLQFPRRVLASILRSPKRVYWEKCRQSKEQEVNDCETFKRFYQEGKLE